MIPVRDPPKSHGLARVGGFGQEMTAARGSSGTLSLSAMRVLSCPSVCGRSVLPSPLSPGAALLGRTVEKESFVPEVDEAAMKIVGYRPSQPPTPSSQKRRPQRLRGGHEVGPLVVCAPPPKALIGLEPATAAGRAGCLRASGPICPRFPCPCSKGGERDGLLASAVLCVSYPPR